MPWLFDVEVHKQHTQPSQTASALSLSPAAEPFLAAKTPVDPPGALFHAPGWGDKLNPKEGEWRCPTCLVMNNKSAVDKCISCDAPKTPAAKAPVDPPGALSPTAGWGDIFKPKEAPTAGWGDTFKPKEGEWKCNTCLTKNPKMAEKCMSCDAPKTYMGGD